MYPTELKSQILNKKINNRGFHWAVALVMSVVLVTVMGCQGMPLTGGSSSSTLPPSSSSGKVGMPIEPKDPGYRIGPEDVLHISVWKEAELDQEVLVRPDGGISFPLAGNMQAAGKTTQELMAEMTRRIQRYIPDAVVTVTVTKVSGYSIFVIGKVSKPGQFTLGRYIDVLQALTLAGGVTPFASESNITILRRQSGKEIRFPFDYSSVKKGKNLDENILLQSGDVVVVP
jgi:polysaccharide export outer membrane protein